MTTSRDSVETAAVKKGRKRPDWLGGFIHTSSRGKRIYVIEKRIGGRLFKRSTRCHTEDAAMKELRKFEANPHSYRPGAAGLHLSKELILEHVDWQMAPKPLGAGNSREWALECGRLLGHWMEPLDGRDLRHVSPTDIKGHLKAWSTSIPTRVVVLKGFYSWARTEKGLLRHHEDPMPDVPIPERKAAKETATGYRDHKFGDVRKVFGLLRKDVRDILELLTATGWHESDLRRFVENGEIRKDPTGKHAAVLVTWHKAKEDAIAGLTEKRHVDVAKRLRAEGHMLSNSTLSRLAKRASSAAGIKGRPVFFGDIRHSFSTWAIEDGHDMMEVARHNNHRTEDMLRKHYVRHAVPRATIKPRMLKK